MYLLTIKFFQLYQQFVDILYYYLIIIIMINLFIFTIIVLILYWLQSLIDSVIRKLKLDSIINK